MRKKIGIILLIAVILCSLLFCFINLSIIKDLFSNPIDINNFKSLNKNDFKFMGITPDQNLSYSKQEIIKILGKANRIIKSEQTVGDTTLLSFTYVYDSFEVYTTLYGVDKEKDIETVDRIKIFGRGPVTNRGLSVGDSEDLIQIKYGPFEKIDDSRYIFYKYFKKIIYHIKDSQIVQIDICPGNAGY